MSMSVEAVMTGLVARLSTISGLRVFDSPPDSLTVPAAIVGFPDPLVYDSTMARGSDQATFPIHVLVGAVSDRASGDALVLYMNGTGASSVKVAIEGDVTLGGAAQSTRVTDVKAQTMAVGAIEYLAASFSIDVIA
jgi:hypothetical protein